MPVARAAGETDPGGGVGRHRATVDLSSTELMLGRTMLGARLGELRAVLAYLRRRAELDASRVAPMPLHFEGLVDGRNCPVSQPALAEAYRPAAGAYAAHPGRLALVESVTDQGSAWLAECWHGS